MRNFAPARNIGPWLRCFVVEFLTALAALLCTPLMFLPGLTGLDLDLCLALMAAVAAVFAAYMAASAGA